MKRVVSGYGTWKSPLTAARVTAGALRFDHLVTDGDDVYWVEGRASEGGRYVVVRRSPDGRLIDVTPAEFNVRTRVHEYGGAAYTVRRGVVYFSNFADQRLYEQRAGEPPRPLTAEGLFYADPRISPDGQTLVAIREDHRTADPVNSVVAISLVDGRERVLVDGADFFSNAAISGDGGRLAWLQWNHPNMPWDGTELRVASFNADGSLGPHTVVAGGVAESIFQPAWSPDGGLFFVSDATGWWNLYRATVATQAGQPEALWPMEVEFGKPQWTFSQSTFCLIDAARLATTFTDQGRWYLGILELSPRRFERIDLPLEPTDGLVWRNGELFVIGGSPTRPLAIARVRNLSALMTQASGGAIAARPEVEVIRSAISDQPDEMWISPARAVTFPSDDREVHAFFYAPHNPEYVAPDGELPPLMVLSHGGPTAASSDVLDLRIQFWTSRGFAILDVNYGGSTGFGRAYRDRLKGEWGIVDVADCVNGAREMVASRQADPDRLVIRGGSAGGYTTLAALTFHDTFKAGASYYGVSDIEVLARDTHKFESRYLDSLVGPYPGARDRYRARSPIHFTDRLSAALILFQGLEDKVVPPNQAEMMAEAVRRKGLPVAYVPFAGEQHGFRKAENIIRSLEGELYFYGAVFGFTPVDPIQPLPIDNLRS
jgi:dipeptidyl aminopeptidase/acylaminoacyl peptidase